MITSEKVSSLYFYIFIAVDESIILNALSDVNINKSRDGRPRLWAERRHCQPVT